MKIVFLSTKIGPNRIVVLKQLVQDYNVKIIVFHQSPKRILPVEGYPEIKFIRKSHYSKEDILKKIKSIQPVLIYMSGWNTVDYLWITKKYRKYINISVISGIDTQWRGTITQRIRILLSSFILKPSISHICAAGIYQFEYARRLGFKKANILLYSLSIDVEYFSKHKYFKEKSKFYPRNFLFVGRFIPEKNLKLLIDVWNSIAKKNSWTLTLIGDGSLEKKLKIQVDDKESVIFKSFMPHDKLVEEVKISGCFILPSKFEQWGLVLHEFAAAGLPLISSDACGATPYFVINNYNGYSFKSDNAISLKINLEKIIKKSDSELMVMAENSASLANIINPRMSAASIMSVLK